jgi:hypothetical protein
MTVVRFRGGRLDGKVRTWFALCHTIVHPIEFRRPLSWNLAEERTSISEHYRVTGGPGVFEAIYVGLQRTGGPRLSFDPARLPA